MALPSALLTGDDVTNHAADYPAIMGTTRLSSGRWNADGNPATADASDASYPATGAYDGHCGTMTRMDAAAQVRWYVADRGANPDPLDALFLHCIEQGYASATLTVYVSDGSTDEEITSISSDHFQSSKRLFVTEMQMSGDSGDEQRQWTTARYIKLKFDAGAGHTCRPQLTEVIAGEQRQLGRLPLHPYSGIDEDTAMDASTTLAGAESTTTHYAGAHAMSGVQYRFENTTQRDLVRSMWADCGRGARPWIWCPNPDTAPDTAYLMRWTESSPRKLRLRRIDGPNIWEWTINAVEQGGYLLVDE